MKLRRSQRGAVALVVALVLVFGMTLVAFFANREMIFEQRTSTNHYRSTRAFEVAEAGLEWAVARLNDDRFLDENCVPSAAGGQSFRERYLGPNLSGTGATFTIANPDVVKASCTVDASGNLTCSCPASGPTSLTAAALPRFAVKFRPDPGLNPVTVEVLAYGCTDDGQPCDSSGTPDATAVVRALYKVRPKFPNAPGAGLVAGGAATTGGNLRVINLDVASNGITINSGTAVDLGSGTTVTTLPGTPPRASVLDSDPSLLALTNADDDGDLYFQSFFGETMAQYRNNPQTWLIKGDCAGRERCSTCTTAQSCGGLMQNLLNQGLTQFWSEKNIAMGTSDVPSVGTIGTANRPIVFAGTQEIEFTGNLTAYGMFFVAANDALATWDYEGSGTAQIFGSFVSRGNFKRGSGSADLIYAPNIFRSGEALGLMVRVPGSWRDRACDYTESC